MMKGPTITAEEARLRTAPLRPPRPQTSTGHTVRITSQTGQQHQDKGHSKRNNLAVVTLNSRRKGTPTK